MSPCELWSQRALCVEMGFAQTFLGTQIVTAEVKVIFIRDLGNFS